MSLINEALKKAQRQRNEPVPSAAAGADAGSSQPIAKRAAPMRAQSVLVVFAAAAVLIVLSVVITVYLLNRPAPAPAPVKPLPTHTVAPSTVDLNAPSPVIVAPPLTPPPAPIGAAPAAVISVPVGAKPVAGSTTPTESGAVASAVPGAVPAHAAESPSALVATGPARTAAPSTKATAPDPAIANFVDAIRVTGIRSSGEGSKVLMNDRVYRVNDIVERTFGLKLITVASDSLTFVDPSGFTYVKNF